MGDRFGRRLIFGIGVGLFAVASAWCGLAPSVTQLIIGRAIQGIGGALLVPGSLAIISASFSEDTRGRAIGTWSGFTSIMNAVKGNQAGVASGINNAVSRTAGLLAVAIFGVVMLHAFNQNLDSRLVTMDLSQEMRLQIDEQRVKLAGLEPPPNVSAETRPALERAVADSFVFGFRVVMVMGAGLALASGLSAWVMIGGKTLAAKSKRSASHMS